MVTTECNEVTLTAVVEACQSPWHEDSLIVDGSMSVTREHPHSSQNRASTPASENRAVWGPRA